MRDPIVGQIRKIRDEHAKRFNYDLKALAADWTKREKESGLTFVDLSKKRPTKPAKKRTSRAA